MAINVDDIDPDFIASARAVVVTGTHLSTETTRAAILKAVDAARDAGTKVVFDIDYRPVLWGLTEPGMGEDRFVASDAVSKVLQQILPLADVIVGTLEEVHIAGGTEDSIEALRAIRDVTHASIVLKLGAGGCAVFEGGIPATLEEAAVYPGFPVEAFNILGAGDAFMAGLLRGYLTGENWEQSCKLANASGALVVSRHGCAPAIPSLAEIRQFIAEGSSYYRLREDPALEQLHWSTTTRTRNREVLAFAFDHRTQLEKLAQENGRGGEAISSFKGLCVQAVSALQERWPARQLGLICDDRYGADALSQAEGSGLWIGRPIECPGTRPLAFEGGDNVSDTLRDWPVTQNVKCLVRYHPDDDPDLKAEQDAALVSLAKACRISRHELLLEVIPPMEMPRDSETVARAMSHIYRLGVFPDMWKLLPPLDAEEWAHWSACISRYDPYCSGVVLLGLDAPEQEVMAALSAAASHKICKGFAVGRTVFGVVADAWFASRIDDATAVAEIAVRYDRLISCWSESRNSAAHLGEASG